MMTSTKPSMSSGERKHLSFDNIYITSNPVLEQGTFRVAESGFGLKTAPDTTYTFEANKLSKVTCTRVCRGYQFQFHMKDADSVTFDNFEKDDLTSIKNHISRVYKVHVEDREIALKGWNWGSVEVEENDENEKPAIVFKVNNKTSFIIPTSQVAVVTAPAKNEVELQMQLPTPKKDQGAILGDSLVEMRLYIPDKKSAGESETEDAEEENDARPFEVFHELVKSKLRPDAGGHTIAFFKDILSLVPKRARMEVDCSVDCARIKTKSYNFKINYANIDRMFLLPKGEDIVYLAISVDPPIRSGQSKYPFAVFQFQLDEEIELDLSISDEAIKSDYNDKLKKSYKGKTYEILSTVLKILSGKKLLSVGTFATAKDEQYVHCVLKQTSENLLFPLEKGFVVIHKNPMYVSYSSIDEVAFARPMMGARLVDMTVTLRGTAPIVFSGIDKENLKPLQDYLTSKNVKVTSVVGDEESGKVNEKIADILGVHDDEDSELDEDYDEEAATKDDQSSDESSAGEDSLSEEDESDSAGDNSDEEDNKLKRKRNGSENSDKQSTKKRKAETTSSKSSSRASSPVSVKKSSAASSPKKTVTSKKAAPVKKTTESKGKEVKKKKDPNAPKRAQTAYNYYQGEARKAITKENSTLTFGEISKLVAEQWRSLPADEKKVFDNKAAEDKKRYEKEMKDYKSDPSAGTKSASASAKSKKSTSSKKNQPSPQVSENESEDSD